MKNVSTRQFLKLLSLGLLYFGKVSPSVARSSHSENGHRSKVKKDRNDMLLLLDDNLGLKDATLLEACNENFSIIKLVDLDHLVATIKKEMPIIAYVPVAIAFEFRNDPTCYPVASALVGNTGSNTTSSLWIVRNDAKFEQIGDLKGTRYGRINRYCTSSFLAPAIVLKQNRLSVNDFFAEIVDVPVQTGNWQNQIDQVIEGKIASTMVSEAAWLAKPDNAQKTRVIAKKDRLPSPVIIIKAQDRVDLSDRFLPCFINQRRSGDAMFSGFARCRGESLAGFYKEIESAFA